MCLLLGDFLRLSLKLGARERITLGEEAALIGQFLGIEQVRFADRLRADVTLEPGAEACTVPPLLLQPIVENAVRHGIAGLVEGGTIDVRAARRGGRLTIRVENPCDPDRRGRAGAGVGLANVRGRLVTAFGDEARVDVAERDGVFRVELTLPADEAGASAGPGAGKETS
jgi:LytS/YehU family sensor histidine kinase